MKCVFSAFPKALLWLFVLYWALLCGIVCMANPPKATLLALAGLPVLVCAGQGLTAWEKKTPKLFWGAFAVLAAAFFAAAALYALEEPAQQRQRRCCAAHGGTGIFCAAMRFFQNCRFHKNRVPLPI